MLETLKAIKRTLLTENIYEGDIFFLQDENENSFEKAYIASYSIPRFEKRRVLFKTGDSPYYVKELLTGKKIPVLYLERLDYDLAKPGHCFKFNILKDKLPEYCIIYDKSYANFQACSNLAKRDLNYVSKTLADYENEDKFLNEKQNTHLIDEILSECLKYVKMVSEKRYQNEKRENKDERAKRILIEKYLNRN